VAVLLTVQPSRPSSVLLVFLAATIVALLVAFRRPIPLAAVLLLLVGGIGIRFAIYSQVGSDVLEVTSAAIDRVFAGLNPYGVGYPESRPPGAPFPYGPLAIFWYLPLADAPRLLELFSASIVLAALAVRGKLFGLAVYATAPVLVALSVDGSNDTSLGLLLLIAFGIAQRRPLVAAVVLAAAVAFKVSAAAWVPAFLFWGGWSVAGAFGIASVVAWAPVLLLWGPASFLRSVEQANQLHGNTTIWSLGSVLRDIFGRAAVLPLEQLRLVLGAVTAGVTLRFVRSLDGVIVAGTLVYLVTLFSGGWSTYAYFAAIGPILCWRLDDWLGLPVEPLVLRRAADVDPEVDSTADPDAPLATAPSPTD
jgi:hypothetical protein